MGPNFRSRLPKSGRSRRWTFESTPEGPQSCPQQQLHGCRASRPLLTTPVAGLLPTTDLAPLKVLLLVGVHIQSHLAGVFQRSHQLPLKGQQPWGLEEQSILINCLAKDIQFQGVKERVHLRGHSGRGRGHGEDKEQDSRPLRAEGKLDTCVPCMLGEQTPGRRARPTGGAREPESMRLSPPTSNAPHVPRVPPRRVHLAS